MDEQAKHAAWVKRLWMLFNLTEDEAIKIWEFQERKCACCRRPIDIKARATVFDHDHETGVGRGWLCFLCNKGIGLLKDSVVLLNAAIEFLGNPPAIAVLGKRYGRIGRTTNKGTCVIRHTGAVEYRCGCHGRTKACPVHKQPSK